MGYQLFVASSAISFTESVIAPAVSCITIEGAVTEGWFLGMGCSLSQLSVAH